jgi:hypothetical protein
MSIAFSSMPAAPGVPPDSMLAMRDFDCRRVSDQCVACSVKIWRWSGLSQEKKVEVLILTQIESTSKGIATSTVWYGTIRTPNWIGAMISIVVCVEVVFWLEVVSLVKVELIDE